MPQFNADVSFISNGTGLVRVAEKAVGTLFKGNLVVSATGQSKGIYFGQNGGAATLVNGKIINIGAIGFSGGALRLRNFVQQGVTNQVLTNFTGQATLYLESGTSFNGAVVFAAPQLYLNGCTFLAKSDLKKTGSEDNDSEGGNTFADNTTIIQNGTGRLRLGVVRADVFNADVTFGGTGTGTLEPAYNNPHSFSRNITVDKALSLGAGNATIFLTGGNTQLINGKAQASMLRLTLNKPANGISLGTSLLVNEVLTLQSGMRCSPIVGLKTRGVKV